MRRLHWGGPPPAGGAAGGGPGLEPGTSRGRLAGCPGYLDAVVGTGHTEGVGSGNANDPGGSLPGRGFRVPALSNFPACALDGLIPSWYMSGVTGKPGTVPRLQGRFQGPVLPRVFDIPIVSYGLALLG